jgi:hypothetical protein
MKQVVFCIFVNSFLAAACRLVVTHQKPYNDQYAGNSEGPGQ